MGLFSRFSKTKKAEADDSPEEVESAVEPEEHEETVDATDPESAGDTADEDLDEDEALLRKSAPFDRAEKGPFDVSEDYPELNRLDLGALKVPVVDGMQVRLDTDDDSTRVLAVTLIHGGGGVQLQAFATPRSEGLWNTVRRQLAAGIADQGGETTELHTTLGTELSALIPATTEDGRPGKRAMRFAGIDGPRWFVRAVFSGKAVTDDEVRAELSALLRGVVVDRGTAAMAPRELIALTPPQVEREDTDQDAAGDEIDPFERGPEITETR